MIVVDSSALIAILMDEPEAKLFFSILIDSSDVAIGTPTLFETYQVAKGKTGPEGRRDIDELLRVAQIRTTDWTGQHLSFALDAFETYGKGSGHQARLNFGDCMAYALAKAIDAPLLYKGEDFAQTDLRSAR